MVSGSVALFLALTFVLASGLERHPVTSWDEVPGSGDSYPSRLPSPPSQIFANRRVLFLLSDGVEDHEVVYQHQFFRDRGAAVSFASPRGGTTLLSDFWRPRYTVTAINITALLESTPDGLLLFDAVFIPGGTPSSSSLRTVTSLASALRRYFEYGGNSRLLAMICSGSELLIESAIFTASGVDSFVGSPASAWPLIRALEHAGLPVDRYQGRNASAFVSSYPSPHGSQRAHLILGKDPTASPYFVVEISRIWANTVEQPPLGPHDGVPLRVDANGTYIAYDIAPVRSTSDVPVVPPVVPPKQVPYTGPVWRDRNVVFAMTSGFLEHEVNYLAEYFERRGANITVVCPGWVVQWKNARVYAFRDPPVMPPYWLDCKTGFAEINAAKVDALVVPGGVFSAMAVLRNDDELATLLAKVATSKTRPVALFDEGAQLLMLPARTAILPLGTAIGTSLYNRIDLINAGYTANDMLAPTVSGKVVVGWQGSDSQGLLRFATILEKLV